MRELTSSDPVFISWAEAILKAEGIVAIRVEPTTLPRRDFPQLADVPFPVGMPEHRLVISDEDWDAARAILKAAKPPDGNDSR